MKYTIKDNNGNLICSVESNNPVNNFSLESINNELKNIDNECANLNKSVEMYNIISDTRAMESLGYISVESEEAKATKENIFKRMWEKIKSLIDKFINWCKNIIPNIKKFFAKLSSNKIIKDKAKRLYEKLSKLKNSNGEDFKYDEKYLYKLYKYFKENDKSIYGLYLECEIYLTLHYLKENSKDNEYKYVFDMTSFENHSFEESYNLINKAYAELEKILDSQMNNKPLPESYMPETCIKIDKIMKQKPISIDKTPEFKDSVIIITIGHVLYNIFTEKYKDYFNEASYELEITKLNNIKKKFENLNKVLSRVNNDNIEILFINSIINYSTKCKMIMMRMLKYYNEIISIINSMQDGDK